MRRRRKQLEVSTFPFLAVLLCTMGSLILVLLVMDRKAKLAARQKAEGAVARTAEDTRREVEERRAVAQRRNEEAHALRERQRQGLHAQLVADEQDLKNQLRLVLLRLEEARKAFRLAQERLEGLRKQVDAERVHIIETEQAAKRERDAAAVSAAEETAAAKAAVAAAIADVAKLESNLAELKAARSREKQTYSVVPYRGKHGDDRRPVYVECSARGVTFHPDRKELSSPLHNEDVRAEVERHVARSAPALRPAAAQEERPPYCLLLVRPDGIEPYWELQSVLRSLQIDFGYEFIDPDWLLDFPEDEQSPSKTWANGSDSGPGLGPVVTPPPGTGVKGVSPLRPTMASGPPVGFPGGNANTSGRPGERTGPGTGPPGTGGPNPSIAGRSASGMAQWPGEPGVGGVAGSRASFEGLFPNRTTPGMNARGTTGGYASGNTDGAIGPRGVGTSGSQVFGSEAAFQGNGAIGVGGVPGTGNSNSGPFAQGTPTEDGTQEQGGQFASARTVPGDGSRILTPGDSGLGAPGQGTNHGTGQPVIGPPSAQSSGANADPRQPVPPGSSPADAPGSGTSGPKREGDSTPVPPGSSDAARGSAQGSQGAGPAGSDPTQPANPADVSRGAASRGADPAYATGQPGSPGRADGSPPARLPLPTDRFRPSKSAGDKEPAPRRLARLNERDWIIYIECREEVAILYPSMTEFPLSALSALPESNALLAAVRRMIERRQSSVRTGDVPYRPEVRFLVRPSCLRTFHATYPALDTLAVPKTRQNLAAEDDVRSVMQ